MAHVDPPPSNALPEELRSVDRELLMEMRLDHSGEGVELRDLTDSLGVTATAIRQRLERMLTRGLVDRKKIVSGRGRPKFRYALTPAGLQIASADPRELADAMWRSIIEISDDQLRESLLHNIASKLGQHYANAIRETDQNTPFSEVVAKSERWVENDSTLSDDDRDLLKNRLDHLSQVMSSHQISVSVGNDGDLPVLDIETCPYPAMSEASHDRAMCKLEEKMLSEALGHPVHLSSCRLDGDQCCQFSPDTASTADPNEVPSSAHQSPSSPHPSIDDA